MRRLAMIGRLFKGRKSNVIDLQAYREKKQWLKDKDSNHKPSKDEAGHKVQLDV